MKRSLAAVSCKVSQDVGKGGTDGANRLPGDWKMSKLLELARCDCLASEMSLRRRWRPPAGRLAVRRVEEEVEELPRETRFDSATRCGSLGDIFLGILN